MSNYFSEEGLKKLKLELLEREGKMRAEIAQKILEAKELGDLSENAEYAEAREAQGMNEGRIAELKDVIQNAVIVGPGHSHKVVAVGASIKVKHNSQERQFTIVGASESDPAKGRISNESPLGAAFMGKKKGEEVEVMVPSGKVKYKILDIK